MREENARYVEEMGAVELGGSEIFIRVPVADLFRAYTKLRSSLGADEYESPDEVMGGFWDWTKKVGQVVKAVVSSPIVRKVAGAIPVVGGTLTTALDMADEAVKAVEDVAKRMPKAARALAADVAAKKPAAAAALKKLSTPARRKVLKMANLHRAMAKTVRDAGELRKVARAAGYTPAMVRALRIPRAPWRR